MLLNWKLIIYFFIDLTRRYQKNREKLFSIQKYKKAIVQVKLYA